MDVVWGVIYLLAAGLTGTGWAIYYIMRTAYIEMRDNESSPVDVPSDTTPSEGIS